MNTVSVMICLIDACRCVCVYVCNNSNFYFISHVFAKKEGDAEDEAKKHDEQGGEESPPQEEDDAEQKEEEGEEEGDKVEEGETEKEEVVEAKEKTTIKNV